MAASPFFFACLSPERSPGQGPLVVAPRLDYNGNRMNPAAEAMAPLLEKLRSGLLPGGGLPYYLGGDLAAEPTLLAALALSVSGAPAGHVDPILDRIRRSQNDDGSIGVDMGHRRQGLWLTALAAIVFLHFRLDGPAERALDFLLSLRSVTAAKDPRLKQDDTLPAWPWVPGTSGWVEPTAWALIALGLSARRRHPRAAEGVRFLLDRQISSGGWNYGNPALDGRDLLPFWDTTGLALVALCGRVEPRQIAASLAILERDGKTIESQSGSAWTVLALASHGRDTIGQKARLMGIMKALPDEELNLANYALGLIALSGRRVFAP